MGTVGQWPAFNYLLYDTTLTVTTRSDMSETSFLKSMPMRYLRVQHPRFDQKQEWGKPWPHHIFMIPSYPPRPERKRMIDHVILSGAACAPVHTARRREEVCTKRQPDSQPVALNGHPSCGAYQSRGRRPEDVPAPHHDLGHINTDVHPRNRIAITRNN